MVDSVMDDAGAVVTGEAGLDKAGPLVTGEAREDET